MAKTSLTGTGAYGRLTDKQKRFVDEYLKHLDAKEASKLAGYSQACPNGQINNLMTHPDVMRAIRRGLRDLQLDARMETDEILYHLVCCATRDPIDLLDDAGQINTSDIAKLPREIRVCIDGIKVTDRFDKEGYKTGQTVELKMVPKQAAIEMCLRYKRLLASTIQPVQGDDDDRPKQVIDLEAMYTEQNEGNVIDVTLAELADRSRNGHANGNGHADGNGHAP